MICEVKRASPSKGCSNRIVDLVATAKLCRGERSRRPRSSPSADHFRGDPRWMNDRPHAAAAAHAVGTSSSSVPDPRRGFARRGRRCSAGGAARRPRWNALHRRGVAARLDALSRSTTRRSWARAARARSSASTTAAHVRGSLDGRASACCRACRNTWSVAESGLSRPRGPRACARRALRRRAHGRGLHDVGRSRRGHPSRPRRDRLAAPEPRHVFGVPHDREGVRSRAARGRGARAIECGADWLGGEPGVEPARGSGLSGEIVARCPAATAVAVMVAPEFAGRSARDR